MPKFWKQTYTGASFILSLEVQVSFADLVEFLVPYILRFCVGRFMSAFLRWEKKSSETLLYQLSLFISQACLHVKTAVHHPLHVMNGFYCIFLSYRKVAWRSKGRWLVSFWCICYLPGVGQAQKLKVTVL